MLHIPTFNRPTLSQRLARAGGPPSQPSHDSRTLSAATYLSHNLLGVGPVMGPILGRHTIISLALWGDATISTGATIWDVLVSDNPTTGDAALWTDSRLSGAINGATGFFAGQQPTLFTLKTSSARPITYYKLVRTANISANRTAAVVLRITWP